MEPTITAVGTLAALVVWHGHTRRHPGWRASDAGRFGVFCGYALVTIAAYWLLIAPTATTWEWALGNLWALAAMVSFVYGFATLNTALVRHAAKAQALEAISPARVRAAD